MAHALHSTYPLHISLHISWIVVTMTTLMSLGAKPKHYARATPKCMPRKQKKKPSQPTLQQLTNLPCVHTSALSPTQQRARLESEQLAMQLEDAESWLYYLDCLEGKAMKRTQKSMSSHEHFKPTSPFHEDYKLSFHEETDSQPGFGQYPPDNNELIDEINSHPLRHEEEDPKKSMLTKKRSLPHPKNSMMKKRRSHESSHLTSQDASYYEQVEVYAT